jgi:hypothetical protein
MDKEKNRDEYKKYLEKQISIIQEEIDYLRGRLKALDYGDEISDSDDDTLEGARVYDSSEYNSTDSE